MKSDRLLASVLMAFALAVFLYARQWQMEAGLYPRAIAVLIFVLAAWLFVRPQDTKRKTMAGMLAQAREHRNVLFVLALTAAFVAAIEVAGFFVALPLYLVLVQLLLGVRGAKGLLIPTAAITAVIYVVFVILLSIRIPIAFWMM